MPVGISQPTLSHLEKTADASTKFVEEFAQALNTTSEYLLYGNNNHQIVGYGSTAPQGMVAVPFFKDVILSAGNGGAYWMKKGVMIAYCFQSHFFQDTVHKLKM